MHKKKICLYKKTQKKKNVLKKWKTLPVCFFLNSTNTSFPVAASFDFQLSVFGTDVLPESTEEEATELFARRNVESFGRGVGWCMGPGGHRRHPPLVIQTSGKANGKKNVSHKKMEIWCKMPIKTS